MITKEGFSTIAKLLKDNILKSRSIINGRYVESEIDRIETTNNSIKIFTYLDETVTGTITKHEIITKDGYIFLGKLDNIVKTSERGLLTMFEIVIKEG